MRLSDEGKVGIALGLLGLAGGGAVVIWPNHIEIGWIMLGLSGFGLILLLLHHLFIKPHQAPVRPALGSIVYQEAVMEVQRRVTTGQTHATLSARVENKNSFLLKFHAKLSGSVEGKGHTKEFYGYMQSGQVGHLTLDRIDDIPVRTNVPFGQPTLSAQLRYDVTYWPARAEGEVDHKQARRTAKTCHYSYFGQLSQPQDMKPGDVVHREQKTTIAFSDEIEF